MFQNNLIFVVVVQFSMFQNIFSLPSRQLCLFENYFPYSVEAARHVSELTSITEAASRVSELSSLYH
jgi:hypothetical protein